MQKKIYEPWEVIDPENLIGIWDSVYNQAFFNEDGSFKLCCDDEEILSCRWKYKEGKILSISDVYYLSEPVDYSEMNVFLLTSEELGIDFDGVIYGFRKSTYQTAAEGMGSIKELYGKWESDYVTLEILSWEKGFMQFPGSERFAITFYVDYINHIDIYKEESNMLYSDYYWEILSLSNEKMIIRIQNENIEFTKKQSQI